VELFIDDGVIELLRAEDARPGALYDGLLSKEFPLGLL
jgi:hypothetical protein